MRRQRDLSHRVADVVAGVHGGHGLVVHVLHRVAQPGQLGIDPGGAVDRVEVPGDQHLGLQQPNPFVGGDGGQGVAVAVAAHGDEIGGDMAEQRSEQVAAQADPLVGEPYDQGVGGLTPPGGGDQLYAAATDVEGESVLDDHVGIGIGLRGGGPRRTASEFPSRWH